MYSNILKWNLLDRYLFLKTIPIVLLDKSIINVNIKYSECKPKVKNINLINNIFLRLTNSNVLINNKFKPLLNSSICKNRLYINWIKFNLNKFNIKFNIIISLFKILFKYDENLNEILNNEIIHNVTLFSILKYKNRSILASTKTRSQVSGSGRKLWKQKGTGRARRGSIRSPITRGGGLSFGPKYRKVSIKINRSFVKILNFILIFIKRKNFYFFKNILNFCPNNINIRNINTILKSKKDNFVLVENNKKYLKISKSFTFDSLINNNIIYIPIYFLKDLIEHLNI